MYIAVCDDHAMECQTVAQIIDAFSKERKIPVRYQLFTDAEEMLRAASVQRFSHYLLDVIMPAMDGITAAQELRAMDTEAKVIFLTTSKEFAYQSYRVKAYDYLLKPIESQQLFDVLEQLQKLEDAEETSLFIPKGRGFLRISPSRLAYLEVSRKKLYFHMTNAQIQQAMGTLTEFEQELLSRPDFVKIHRSYIVNLNQIQSLSSDGCIMLGRQNLPISRLLYNQVRDRYMTHLFAGTEG